MVMLYHVETESDRKIVARPNYFGNIFGEEELLLAQNMMELLTPPQRSSAAFLAGKKKQLFFGRNIALHA